MTKPERHELFDRAQGLLKRAADAVGGGQAANDDTSASAARRLRLILLTVAAIVVAIIVVAVASRIGSDENANTGPVDTSQAVAVVTVSMQPFHPKIALNGEARPQRDIQVAAPATGVRILQLLVDEGDTVRAGQAMARLDTAVAEAQIRASQASVAEAESAAIRARGEYERAESIRDSGALSTEAIEARRAAATAADARLAAARAQLAETNGRLQGGYVRAPSAGLVISRTAEVGRPVDGQVLFRIAADNALEVAAQVAESDVLALQDGQPAIFQLLDGTTVEARLRRAPASIDSRTRTGQALFSLPQGTRVRAGMFLRGEAQLAERQELAAPQTSVLYDNGQAYVLTVDNRNIVHRTNVETGVRDGDMVQIISGLTAGQRLVGSGAAFLQDGDHVRPLAVQAPVAPAAATPPSAPAQDSAKLRGREG